MSKEELAAHSPLGPSSADRWINCPGSVKATAGLPDTTSMFAAEGTFAHLVSEVMRDDCKSAKDMIGFKDTIDGYSFEVDQAMAEHVERFVDYVAEHMPEKHRRMSEWSPERFARWAEKTGPATAALITRVLGARRHPEQSYRTCLGILRLAKPYGDARLEALKELGEIYAGPLDNAAYALATLGDLYLKRPTPQMREQPLCDPGDLLRAFHVLPLVIRHVALPRPSGTGGRLRRSCRGCLG